MGFSERLDTILNWTEQALDLAATDFVVRFWLAEWAVTWI